MVDAPPLRLEGCKQPEFPHHLHYSTCSPPSDTTTCRRTGSDQQVRQRCIFCAMLANPEYLPRQAWDKRRKKLNTRRFRTGRKRPAADGAPRPGWYVKTVCFSHLCIEIIILPRQVRDKCRKTQNQMRFLSGTVMVVSTAAARGAIAATMLHVTPSRMRAALRSSRVTRGLVNRAAVPYPKRCRMKAFILEQIDFSI